MNTRIRLSQSLLLLITVLIALTVSSMTASGSDLATGDRPTRLKFEPVVTVKPFEVPDISNLYISDSPRSTSDTNSGTAPGGPFAPLGNFYTSSINLTKMAFANDGTIYSDHHISKSGGQLWQPITPPDSDDEFMISGWNTLGVRVAANYATSKTALMLMNDGFSPTVGLMISQDDGKSWQRILKPASGSRDVGTVDAQFAASDPTARTIFASFQDLSENNTSIYLTSNAGQSWNKLTTYPSIPPQKLQVPDDYNQHKTILGYNSSGILKFNGNTDRWTHLNSGIFLDNGNNRVTNIFVSPNYQSDKTIFANTDYHLYRSTNGGSTWARFTDFRVRDLILSPNYSFTQGGSRKMMIVAPVSSGAENFDALFLSDNDGASWNSLLRQPINPVFATANNGDPIIYAATIAQNGNGEQLLSSSDNGKTWLIVNNRVGPSSVGKIYTTPTFATDLTAFISSFKQPKQLWRTRSGGLFWEKLALPSTDIIEYSLAISPDYALDKTLFLLTVNQTASDSAKLYRSVDDGDSWTLLQQQLAIQSNSASPLSVSRNSSGSISIYVAANFGGESHFDLYRSDDLGTTWNALNVPFSDEPFNRRSINNIAVTASGSALFVSTTDVGAMFSHNEGALWSTVPGSANHALSEIVLSPGYDSDQTVIVFDAFEGLLKSVDGGGSWQSVDIGQGIEHFSLALAKSYSDNQTMLATIDYEFPKLSEDDGITWFDLGFSMEVGPVILEDVSNRLYIIAAANNGVYVYLWPTTVSSSFTCAGGIDLTSTDAQYASIGISGASAENLPWEVSEQLDWLSFNNASGSLPNMPLATIDPTSVSTSSVSGSVELSVYYSYRNKVTLEQEIFAPCFGVSLPIVRK